MDNFDYLKFNKNRKAFTALSLIATFTPWICDNQICDRLTVSDSQENIPIYTTDFNQKVSGVSASVFSSIDFIK